jgi:hypothetical protein
MKKKKKKAENDDYVEEEEALNGQVKELTELNLGKKTEAKSKEDENKKLQSELTQLHQSVRVL